MADAMAYMGYGVRVPQAGIEPATLRLGGESTVRSDHPNTPVLSVKRGDCLGLLGQSMADKMADMEYDGDMTTADTAVRVYLPETFIDDAQECNPDLWPLWERIIDLPRARRGGGYGRWADLTADEARAIRDEAEYRRQYWLTDAYGVEGVAPNERAAGKAAERVAASLKVARP